jgi:hypothetical protein
MKKLIVLLVLACFGFAGSANAQTYTFDVLINDQQPSPSDHFYVYIKAFLGNGTELGPFYVYDFWGSTTSPIPAPGLNYNFTGLITPPNPPVPSNFIYFRVLISENGGTPRYCDSEWFPYDAGGWTSSQALSFSF